MLSSYFYGIPNKGNNKSEIPRQSMFHAYEISRKLLELELCAGAYDYAIASQER